LAADNKPQVAGKRGDWRNSTYLYDNFINSRKVNLVRFPGSSGGGAEVSESDAPAALDYATAMRDPSKRIAYASPLAAQGNRDGMYMLGWCYMQGNCGAAVDKPLAATWLRKAADAGHAWAMVDYGTALANGVGVTLDDVKAVDYFKRAIAATGDKAAHAALGVAYFNGSGVPQDAAKALQHFLKAEPEPRALGMLGLVYDYGFGVPIDEARGEAYLKRGAEAGDPKAMAYYGVKLVEGTPSTPVNLALARRYFEAAIPRGETVAMHNQAALLLEGKQADGAQPDPAAALMLFQRAADMDYAPSIYKLAVAYRRGQMGLAKSDDKAIELAKVAADGGMSEPLDFMTVIYLNSNRHAEARATNDRALKFGTSKAYLHRAQAEDEGLMGYAPNTPTAVQWFQKAADGGEAQAHLRLGFAHLQGELGLRDAVQGRKHLKRAADAGVMDAQSLLGQCYEKGLGGPPDRDAAIAMYKLAAAGGSARAAASLKRLGAS
jgi:TPR repeat protein